MCCDAGYDRFNETLDIGGLRTPLPVASPGFFPKLVSLLAVSSPVTKRSA